MWNINESMFNKLLRFLKMWMKSCGWVLTRWTKTRIDIHSSVTETKSDDEWCWQTICVCVGGKMQYSLVTSRESASGDFSFWLWCCVLVPRCPKQCPKHVVNQWVMTQWKTTENIMLHPQFILAKQDEAQRCGCGHRQNMSAFDLFLMVAFVVGAAAGMLVATCLCRWSSHRHDQDCTRDGRLDFPELVYVTRAGGSYHSSADCPSVAKNGSLLALKYCQHCFKSVARRNRKAKDIWWHAHLSV